MSLLVGPGQVVIVGAAARSAAAWANISARVFMANFWSGVAMRIAIDALLNCSAVNLGAGVSFMACPSV